MRVDAVNTTMFTSNKSTVVKELRKLSQDAKFTDIKPIKNYTQYLMEYGLNIKPRKK